VGSISSPNTLKCITNRFVANKSVGNRFCLLFVEESAFSGWSGRMPNLLSMAELFYQNNFAHGAECWGGHLDYV
jgi:hypothetical protein